MTRQGFYELCVEKTFIEAYFDASNPLHDTAMMVGDVPNMTFSQIAMTIDVKGLEPHVPLHEDFRKWGVGYLAQLMGFVGNLGDGDFSETFFGFLRQNRSLYRKPSDMENLGHVCLTAFTDHVLSRDVFVRELVDFILDNFSSEGWFDEFLTTAYSMCLVEHKRYMELRGRTARAVQYSQEK